MKNQFESPEIFEAYGRIDASLFMLNELNESLNNRKPIERAIDESTGYEKHIYSQVLGLLRGVVSDKKLIEANYANDQAAIDAIIKKYPEFV